MPPSMVNCIRIEDLLAEKLYPHSSGNSPERHLQHNATRASTLHHHKNITLPILNRNRCLYFTGTGWEPGTQQTPAHRIQIHLLRRRLMRDHQQTTGMGLQSQISAPLPHIHPHSLPPSTSLLRVWLPGPPYPYQSAFLCCRRGEWLDRHGEPQTTVQYQLLLHYHI